MIGNGDLPKTLAAKRGPDWNFMKKGG